MNDDNDRRFDPKGSVTFRAQAIWFRETGYPEDHPSQLMMDIAANYEETTSDVNILLDALWNKDLTLVNREWREAQATQLDRERRHLDLLLQNAATVLRALRFAEPPGDVFEPFDRTLYEARGYSIGPAPESTGIPEIDEAEAAARSRLIEVLEADRNPEGDAVYRWLLDRLMALEQQHGVEDER